MPNENQASARHPAGRTVAAAIAAFMGAQGVAAGDERPAASADVQLAAGSPQGRHQRLAVALSRTHVPRREGGTFFAPTVGMDWELWLGGQFGCGLHGDVVADTMVVEGAAPDTAEGTLERSFPFVLTADLMWKPWRGLVGELGPGIELERNKSLFVVRAGLSYEIELPGDLDVAPVAYYDVRPGYFDAWTIGLAFGKSFGR